MLASDTTTTIRESVEQADFARLATVGEDLLASEVVDRDALAARWEAIIDRKLIEWGNWQACKNLRADLEADDLISPTPAAIRKAYLLVARMRERSWPLPTGIIPDGEGGIVFENRHGSLYQRIEIDEHGVMSLVTFDQATLVDRSPIDVR